MSNELRHPCLCDICLKARDKELNRLRTRLIEEIEEKKKELVSYNGVYNKGNNRGLSMAQEIIKDEI